MLKQLIQRLLDSRTTPEEAGHSAMPSPTEVSLTPSVTSKEVWGDVCTGTASSDGYIRMDFGATSPEAIGSARSFGAVAFSTPQKAGDFVSVICPVAKGRAYAMSARNANNITCTFVKLIGSIGGEGYQALKNALLQGGAICLSNLCSSLRRSSWLAKSLGFTKIPSLLRTTLSPCFQVLQEFQNEATQRRLMEWPLSLLEKHRPKIFPVSWRSTVSGDNSSKTLNKVGKLIRLFTSLKATFFTWQQGAVIQRSVSSCSIPRPNLTVGGASC